MELAYTKEAIKALKRVQPKVSRTLREALAKIATDPFATHPNALPMEGTKSGFRLRHGDWKALYVVDRAKQMMTIVDVKSRGEAYK
jgi:mRNA interferase RelE/StbE